MDYISQIAAVPALMGIIFSDFVLQVMAMENGRNNASVKTSWCCGCIGSSFCDTPSRQISIDQIRLAIGISSKDVPSPNTQRSHSKIPIKLNTIIVVSTSCLPNENLSRTWPMNIGVYRHRSLIATTMIAPTAPYFTKLRGRPIKSHANFKPLAMEEY